MLFSDSCHTVDFHIDSDIGCQNNPANATSGSLPNSMDSITVEKLDPKDKYRACLASYEDKDSENKCLQASSLTSLLCISFW